MWRRKRIIIRKKMWKGKKNNNEKRKCEKGKRIRKDNMWNISKKGRGGENKKRKCVKWYED